MRFTALAIGASLWLLAVATAAGMDIRETELFAALDRFDAGDRSGGFESLYQVTAKYPDFLAARIIQASLLQTEDIAETLVEFAPVDDSSPVKEPRDEAYARLSYWFDRPASGHLPNVLIEAAPDRNNVVVTDAARSRLYLFDRSEGEWTMWGDWYTSIGRGGTAKRREGDGKTPLGVYFITMWVGDRFLPELYGSGALGLNYPNEWDESRRRNGHGIWIHGEPRGLKSRAPRWSRGCLTISNPALEALAEAIEAQSIPVIIGERLRWLAPGRPRPAARGLAGPGCVPRRRKRHGPRGRDLRLSGRGRRRIDHGPRGIPRQAGGGQALVAVLARERRRGVAHRPRGARLVPRDPPQGAAAPDAAGRSAPLRPVIPRAGGD